MFKHYTGDNNNNYVYKLGFEIINILIQFPIIFVKG